MPPQLTASLGARSICHTDKNGLEGQVRRLFGSTGAGCRRWGEFTGQPRLGSRYRRSRRVGFFFEGEALAGHGLCRSERTCPFLESPFHSRNVPRPLMSKHDVSYCADHQQPKGRNDSQRHFLFAANFEPSHTPLSFMA
jgi:hypothetical protein